MNLFRSFDARHGMWVVSGLNLVGLGVVLALLLSEPHLAAPGEIAERANPAIVTLLVDASARASAKDTGQASAPLRETYGSGFFVRSGFILTNAHVVKGAKRVRVQFFDGAVEEGTIVGSDDVTDLALVKADGHVPATLDFAPSEKTQIGSRVVAVGSPLRLTNSVTVGVVSGRHRAMRPIAPDWYLQHDAAINPGSSGSPLLNAEGNVIGVNSALPDGDFSYAGVSLAVPSEVAERTIAELIANKGISRGRLGFVGRSIDLEIASALDRPRDTGVLVQSVDENGPAARAGMKLGDIIVSANGEAVRQPSTLVRLWAESRAGDTLMLKVERATGTVELRPVLDPMRQPSTISLALELNALVSVMQHGLTIRADGVEKFMVSAVKPDSLGAAAGINVGDKVLAVGREPLRQGDDGTAQLAKQKGPPWLLLLQREGQAPEYVVVGKYQFHSKLGSNVRQAGEFSL